MQERFTCEVAGWTPRGLRITVEVRLWATSLAQASADAPEAARKELGPLLERVDYVAVRSHRATPAIPA